MSEAPPVPAPKTSPWEDLLDVFIAPVQLFRRRADGRFGLALLVLVVLTLLIFLVTRGAMQPILDAESASRMTARSNVTPEQLESIVNGVQALLMDESQLTSRHSVSLGLGRFLDSGQTDPLVLTVLSRVDLFTLWATLLIAVGLEQVARTTTGQAMAGGAMVWLVGSLPLVLQQALTPG